MTILQQLNLFDTPTQQAGRSTTEIERQPAAVIPMMMWQCEHRKPDVADVIAAARYFYSKYDKQPRAAIVPESWPTIALDGLTIIYSPSVPQGILYISPLNEAV